MKKIAIGTADFREIIIQNNLFVDKSMLIHDILDTATEVFLFPRPRRFGKSLNISMLRYFFEKTKNTHYELFSDLKIAQYPEIMKLQGQFPVIDFSFKDVKSLGGWESMSAIFKTIISKEYQRHDYLLDSLNADNKKYFKSIISKKGTQDDFTTSILNLSLFLHDYHNSKVLLLIDEYDTPLNDAYIKGFLPEARNFISGLYGTALKGNPYLFKAVITGIYRVSKESIFSGLNNLVVCSILENKCVNHFGFTEPEMEKIFTEYRFTEEEKNDVTSWYNGYLWGNNTVIYNPWSILNYLFFDKSLKPHWVNTSTNDLIKEMVSNCTVEEKQDFEVLLQGGCVQKPIIADIVFDELLEKEDALWSFFYFSGYLKLANIYKIEDHLYGDFQIVNRELRTIFRDSVLYWFDKSRTLSKFDQILELLVKNNLKEFSKYFTDFITRVTSYYDFADKEPERVYHALVLGMMVNLQSKYQITSNRESGFGRYDIMLKPLLPDLPAYIFEFKKFDAEDENDIQDTLDSALNQIKEKEYTAELQQLGHNNIILMAFAFKGKQVKLVWEKV